MVAATAPAAGGDAAAAAGLRPSRLGAMRRWLTGGGGSYGASPAASAAAPTFRFALHVSGGDGRIWQFGFADDSAARDWAAVLRAFSVRRDALLARTLPRTRSGGAGAEDAVVRALLVTRD